MLIIVAVIIFIIYLACPIIGKIVLLLANSILPDPVPYIDEIIMWIGLFMHLNRLMRIAEFISEHKKAVVISVIVVVIVILVLIILI